MIEIAAGEGYNDGAELRLLIQSQDIATVPQALESLSPEQAQIFAGYRREPSDYRPLFGHHDGFRFNDEWTFPIAEVK